MEALSPRELPQGSAAGATQRTPVPPSLLGAAPTLDDLALLWTPSAVTPPLRM